MPWCASILVAAAPLPLRFPTQPALVITPRRSARCRQHRLRYVTVTCHSLQARLTVVVVVVAMNKFSLVNSCLGSTGGWAAKISMKSACKDQSNNHQQEDTQRNINKNTPHYMRHYYHCG